MPFARETISGTLMARVGAPLPPAGELGAWPRSWHRQPSPSRWPASTPSRWRRISSCSAASCHRRRRYRSITSRAASRPGAASSGTRRTSPAPVSWTAWPPSASWATHDRPVLCARCRCAEWSGGLGPGAGTGSGGACRWQPVAGGATTGAAGHGPAGAAVRPLELTEPLVRPPAVVPPPPPPPSRWRRRPQCRAGVRRRWVRWLVALVVLLVAGGAGTFAVMRYEVYAHVVPAMAGRTFGAAEAAADQAGLVARKTSSRYDAAVPAGQRDLAVDRPGEPRAAGHGDRRLGLSRGPSRGRARLDGQDASRPPWRPCAPLTSSPGAVRYEHTMSVKQGHVISWADKGRDVVPGTEDRRSRLGRPSVREVRQPAPIWRTPSGGGAAQRTTEPRPEVPLLLQWRGGR